MQSIRKCIVGWKRKMYSKHTRVCFITILPLNNIHQLLPSIIAMSLDWALSDRFGIIKTSDIGANVISDVTWMCKWGVWQTALLYLAIQALTSIFLFLSKIKDWSSKRAIADRLRLMLRYVQRARWCSVGDRIISHNTQRTVKRRVLSQSLTDCNKAFSKTSRIRHQTS